MSAHKLADNQSLRTFFQQLDALAIQQKLGQDIYQKGLNYYENDAVESLDVADASKVEANVCGTDEYEVKIFARSGSVQAKCSCPYDSEWGSFCKHIAAVLIKAVEEEFWQEIPEAPVAESPAPFSKKEGSSGGSDMFETWLESLSAEELRQTIRKLATPAFQEEIRLRYASQGDREQVFLEVKKKILKSLKRLGNYHGGQDFEEKITPLLEKLRGVWIERAAEVKDLFLNIMEAVEEAQDEGTMFDEYSEESYDGSELMGFLADFLSDLPDAQRLAFLPEIWKAVNEESYDSFSVFFSMAPDYLKPTDWGALKKYLADSELLSDVNFAQNAHEIFEPSMSPEEKGEWLKNLSERSDRFILPLALFYEKEKGDVKKAVKTLDKALEKWSKKESSFWSPGETAKQVLEGRIRLAQAQKEPIEGIAHCYVEVMPKAESLRRALELAPQERQTLEDLLRQKNSSEYLAYLESEKRLEEVVNIIEAKKKEFSYGSSFGFSSGFSRYDFYVRHKKELPEKALACFRERLEEELKDTGDRHYSAVVDALKNMKGLMEEGAFRRLLADIRLTYKRRTNLMNLMSGAFGKG